MYSPSIIPMLITSIKLALSITLFLSPNNTFDEHTSLEEMLHSKVEPSTKVVQLRLAVPVPTSYSKQSAEKAINLRSRKLLGESGSSAIKGKSGGESELAEQSKASVSPKSIKKTKMEGAGAHNHNQTSNHNFKNPSTSNSPTATHSNSHSPINPFHLDYSGPRIHPPRNN